MTNALLVAFVTFLVASGNFVQSEKCRETGRCRCEYDDGRIIDLNEMVNKNGPLQTIDPFTNDTYYFHPCSNTRLPELKGCSDGDGYALCRYENKTSTYTRLANATNSSFLSSQDGEQYLIMRSNETVLFSFQLFCMNHDKSYIFVNQQNKLENQTNFRMMLFSSHACSYTVPGSTGKVLLILFFVGIFTYFTIGSIVRFMYLGARGIEVVPNLDFWKDLPGLVRDGASFVRNGCRVERSPDPDSYDAI
ncbi:cation-dependent mannose-6-phosphate receptor-like [Toxorhynchites rutilus septentrionalis]|uniref:cation-dependent mannose-6-phosphate receptor-like n=1 Tax=Toxorhynchites rutilus septentrionalis TaxID=329112 RepID=UPI00247A381E|nr:cation-dependent mannose-6-phosphate receptor-like [Toxorhynchites rutilus septentrionalis]